MSQKPKAKIGRPSEYCADRAAEICGRMAEGESLKSICRDDRMPDIKTVYRWMMANAEFRHQYACAREDQADTMADEIIDIADEKTEDANSRRVRIDARKWVAAKLKPKKYGDKVETTVQGPGGGPVENKWTVEFVNPTKKD
jgi:hypothetical protein